MAMTAATVRARLRVPLYRNGYALVAGAGLTSGLGLLYWLLAARSYSETDLGLSAGLISAMTLLANLAQLNLKNALNRFLPTAGGRSAGLTLRAYAVALTLAAVAGLVFVLGVGAFAPRLAPLLADPLLAGWFVVATMAWTIFVLQDSVLAGIRRAGLVPLENLVFAVAKIALVVALATAAPVAGAFLSWSLPVVALIIPVNVIVFVRLIPRHVAETRERPATARTIAGYLAADAVAYAVWTCVISGLPLAVLAIAGPAENAHYFVCWAVAYSLYLVSSGMCQSLLAEVSADPERSREHARRIRRDTLAIVGSGAAAITVLAPVLLRMLGGRYTDEATETLRALALSAVPFAYTSVEVYTARALGRMRLVVGTYTALAALVLAIGLPWLARAGIEGLGNAWLIAQVLVAAALWARRTLPTIGEARVVRALWPGARVIGRHTGGGDVSVCAIKGDRILRRARSAAGDAAIRRHARALEALTGFPLAPDLLATGRVGERAFAAESALTGRPATAAQLPAGFVAAVTEAMRPLHDGTSVHVRVGGEQLDAWVHAPVRQLRAVAPGPLVDRLEAELVEALRDRVVEVGAVHGDLWAGNVLVDGDGSVTGIVDWEAHSAQGLPAVDLAHLELTTRALASRRELGAVVRQALGRRAEPGARTAILLAWLGHVAQNLAKSPRYARNPVWRRRNLLPVLETVSRQAAAAGRFAPRVRSWAWAPPALLGAGALTWLATLPFIHTGAMTDLGLVSVLPPSAFAGLAVLLAGVVALVDRGSPRAAGAGLAVLALTLHATPSLLYPTLRYPWAYKHVGIIDYISRHHGVAPGIDHLPVYHDWPGFFGLGALATALAGLPDALAQAAWAPPVFNLLDVAALLVLARALTGEGALARRACLIFLVASWVGQDYFAPQAFAFLLYLVLLGVVVRRRSSGLALVLIAAIVVSHPLTGVMTVLALTALVLVGACTVRWLPLAAAGLTAAWDLTFAAPYTVPHLGGVLSSIHLPWTTAGETLARSGAVSDGQRLVAFAGRGIVLLMLGLAALGVVRAYRAGRLDRATPVLVMAPVALFAAGDYDGEMVFRIYLFALPFLAVLAARAFGPRPLALGAAVAALLGLFLFAYYGKDHQYVFTRSELAAARFVYEGDGPTLLVEGTPSYPAQFAGYERVTHVPLSAEDDATQRRVAADPAGVLADWLSDPHYRHAYVILTRSQHIDAAEVGTIMPARLDAVARGLASSPRFRAAFRSRDAVVYEVAR
jgi:O-antigen/teichoic acid export membrane protein/aminoglycoside phosphotransferase